MDLDAILKKPLDGDLLSEAEAEALLLLPPAARGPVLAAADRLNRRLNGDRVSYIVNRNINFTNACTAACAFCGYRVEPGAAETFVLGPDEVVELAGRTPGIDEVCMVGGLNPDVTFAHVLSLFAAVHEAYPDVHVHALSPMEVEYYGGRAGLSPRAAVLPTAGKRRFNRTSRLVALPGYRAVGIGSAVLNALAELAPKQCPLRQATGRWEVTSSPKAAALHGRVAGATGETKLRHLKCAALRPCGNGWIMRPGKDPP